MKKTKKFRSFVSYCLAFIITLGFMPLGLVNFDRASLAVAASQSTSGGYYYSQLSEDAKKFYNAIDAMNSLGMLAAGNEEYDLVSSGVVTQAQLASYSSSNDILIAYGAARDAYRMEHPEVFYVDFSYLSISVSSGPDGYIATLGTGRTESYLASGFTAENLADQTNGAITAFNNKVSEIVNNIPSSVTTASGKIKYVNSYLVDNVVYTWAASADESGTTYDSDGAANYIHSAYGAIIMGKAVCEGYSHAFKVIMDALNIPCVLVSGYAESTEGDGYQAHMWNYVQVDGQWYAVDVTWNDGENLDPEGYLLRGNSVISLDHETNGVLSDANVEFRYPALAAYDYGITEVDGLSIEYVQNSNSNSSDMLLKIRYLGKTAQELQKGSDKLYIAVRYYTTSGVWTNWYDMVSVLFDEKDANDVENQNYTIAITSQYCQFAVIDCAPDSADDMGKIFSADKLKNYNIITMSEPYGNANYGTHVAPPYMVSKSPSADTALKTSETYTMEIVYDENLKIKDISQSYGVIVVSKHSDIAKYVTIDKVQWSALEANKITFEFTPSQMFQHRAETYTFYLVNLVGKDSGAAPAGTSYQTEQTSIVCDKVYGDGRLYMKVYGEPSLVATDDLSLTGWQYTDSKNESQYVLQNQRSQLMLVASRPSSSDSTDMINSALANEQTDINSVLTSETFELSVDICSKYVTIPNGSYMQLAFGFPAGYGPENEGVTFKVYHFKRGEDGKIDYNQTEELDCVITAYGLVVTVSDFSPFAVVAYSSNAVSYSAKTIFASTTSLGGGFISDYKYGNIAKLGESADDDVVESVTYTFAPATGYKVDRVLLNGTDITSRVEENSLTIQKDDLTKSSNTLEVSFVAQTVAAKEQENANSGIAVVYPSTTVVDPMGTISASISATTTKVLKGGSTQIIADVERHNSTVIGNITYQWYKDGVLIDDDSLLSEDGSVLSIANFSDSDEGEYMVKVTYTYGERSQTATTSSVKLQMTEESGFNIYIFSATLAVIVVFAITMIISSKIRKHQVVEPIE